MVEFTFPNIGEVVTSFSLERRRQFVALRTEAIATAEREAATRIETNPIPTETEEELGAFLEMLEPQVRDAIIGMHQKGYNIESSGFGGKYSNMQSMDGIYTIDKETKAKLALMGVKVESRKFFQHHTYTHMEFHPKEPDLEKIKAQWDAITALLPDTGQPALPSTTDGSIRFRKQYALHSSYLEEWQGHVLSLPPKLQVRATRPLQPPVRSDRTK